MIGEAIDLTRLVRFEAAADHATRAFGIRLAAAAHRLVLEEGAGER